VRASPHADGRACPAFTCGITFSCD
jgi:hypothetical protein